MRVADIFDALFGITRRMASRRRRATPGLPDISARAGCAAQYGRRRFRRAGVSCIIATIIYEMSITDDTR